MSATTELTTADLFDVPEAPARKPRVRSKSSGKRKPGTFAPHICIYVSPGQIEEVKADAKKFGYASVSAYVQAALTKFHQVCNND